MNVELERLEARKKIVREAAKSMLDAADEANRALTDAEQTLFDAHVKELDELNTKIVEEQGKHVRHKPHNIWPSSDGSSWSDDDPPTSVKGRIGGKYAELFPGRSGVNMDSREFFSALHSGTFHPNLQTLNEGTGSAGGYLLPDQVVADYMGVAYENSLVWQRATVFPMISETLKVAGFDASSAADKTLFGGMTWGWLGEETAGTASNPTLVKRTLKAKKLALFATSSNELVEDGLSLQTQLERAMQQGSGWALDYSFFNGTGAGEPLGILNDPALIVVDPEGDQDADSICYENCIKMLARIHPACFARCEWFCHQSAIPQLLSLATTIGLAGTPVPVLKETDGGWSLLTRPLHFTEKLPVVGDQGDLVLADLSQYAVGLRRQLTIERSAHVNFMSDLMTWRGIMRVDGQGLWTSAYQPVNSADTVSWVVTLGERA